MRVLVVDHTSIVSGAQHALFDLFAYLPEGVTLALACPSGEFADRAQRMGMEWIPLPGTRASFRLHPRHTPAAIVELTKSALHLRRISAPFDVIHANSSRAGLIAALAGRTGGPPFVVQIHDSTPAGRVPKIVNAILRNRACRLVANSQHVARSVGGRTGTCAVLYNPLDLARFQPGRIGRSGARAQLGLDPDVPLIAVIAQITPWKGQDDAIRVLASLRQSTHANAELALVGAPKFAFSTRYDNQLFARSLRSLADQLGVAGSLHFLGERDDIPTVLEAIDVVLVPSWDEPFGRGVVEAMAMEVAVVATDVGGPSEVIEDGVSGRLVPPRRPAAWAAAVAELLADPIERLEIGRRGRATVVERFDAVAYARRMVDVYNAAGTTPVPVDA